MSRHATVVVPELHQDKRLSGLCPDVCWLCPGIAGYDQGYLSFDWPLGQAEVAGFLDDISEMIRSGMTGAELRTLQQLKNRGRSVFLEEQEMRSVLLGKASGMSDMDRIRRQAQRFLILTWALEAMVMDMHSLSAACAQKEQFFHRLLSGTDRSATDDIAQQTSADRPDAAYLPDWKMVLGQMAIFLPQPVALCVMPSSAMARDLEQSAAWRASSAAPQSCPDSLLPLGQTLQGRHLPFWALLGFDHAVQNRPWLTKEADIFMIQSV